MQSLMDYGGLIFDQIGSKLICFGSNGVVVFTGLQIGVATQSKSKVVLFVTRYSAFHGTLDWPYNVDSFYTTLG